MFLAEVATLQTTSTPVAMPNTGRKGRPEAAQTMTEITAPTTTAQTRMNPTSNRKCPIMFRW